MIITNQLLTEVQWDELQKLIEITKLKDGGLPKFYPELLKRKRSAGSNLLYYLNIEGKPTLVGFLSSYFFYEKACEITLLVHPAFRKQHIARALLNEVLPLLKGHQIEDMIVSSSATLDCAWLLNRGFSYHHSEYHMERLSTEPCLINEPLLTLKQAHALDVPTLTAIDIACFSEQDVDMVARLNYLLAQQDYSIFLAFYNNIVVGKAHIKVQEKGATFSDIAILPEHQRKGLGNELLAHCINLALSQGLFRLTLDVEATNQHALKLYSDHGFKVIESFDYWQIKLPITFLHVT